MNENLRDDEVSDLYELIDRMDESIVEEDLFRLEELLNMAFVSLVSDGGGAEVLGQWICEKLTGWERKGFVGIGKILMQYLFSRDRFSSDVDLEVRDFCFRNIGRIDDVETNQAMAEILEGS